MNKRDRKERETSLRSILNTEGLFRFASAAERDTVASALRDAYDAAWVTIAPFYVRAVHRMLGDIRAAAASGATLASVGRDGENCRMIVLAFEPGLDIVDLPLNRSIVRSALADLKHNHGRTFPELDAMLGTMAWPDPSPEEIADAARNLTTLLRRLGLPVDEPEPRQDVVLLDNGMRGTARAALKQMYWPLARGTLVRGLYLFRAAAHHDPNPDADRGYLFDLDAESGKGGKNLLVLPDDPDLEGLTFRANDALVLIEVLTSGPKTTPEGIDVQGRPVQGLFRDEPPAKGINPVHRSARYTGPRVCEGVLRAVREAIGNHARFAARREREGADVQELLRPGHERMVQNTRDWIAGNLDAMHPGLRELAVTYCWRTAQSHANVKLADAIDAAGLSAETARTVWTEFDGLRDDTAKEEFIERLAGSPRES
ncbi:hypothetical protein BKA00_006821 [Actinomadura coerulea]|uniref:Uncharacterized protein n=1 Tax=Actinomadura coerulea TaxID=46159 RepID=A0A7X0G746_9ACTN|nr:hypothetical protein [Actinomadura coerulea]MBB6399907.1 hypothetical protein [Actinomadura coerulea]